MGNSETNRALRERRRQAGLCMRCGQAPLDDASYCATCRLDERARLRIIMERKREKRAAAGRCPTCGRHPADPGKVCEACRARMREAYRRAREDRLRKHAAATRKAKEAGLCGRCHLQPALDGGNCAECRAQHQAWRDANRERVREYAKRERDLSRAQALEAYGNRCACCGESQPEFLVIDHVANDGAAHRKWLGRRKLCHWLRQEGYPPGFQVLCHNCNMAKAFYGICPHQRGLWTATPLL